MSTTLAALADYLFSGADRTDDADCVRRPRAAHESPAAAPSTASADLAVDDAQRVVTRVRAGDADAFAALMRAHYNALTRFVASMLPSPEGAEDLVQDIFLRVWTARARLDPQRSIRTYLFTAARNRALDHYKRERAQRSLTAAVTQDVASRDAAAATPDEELDARATEAGDEVRVGALAREVAALPERQRSALVLRFEQEMTYGEIGAVLGCSEKAAQQVVLRTIAALRRVLVP